ncbi:hypothetical protein D3C76_1087350 [compost metagenome]
MLCVATAGIDERATADLADQQVVIGQAGIGVGHGLARYAQLFGQQPGRRELRPGGKPAAFDALAQLPIELFGQLLAAFKGDMQFHGGVRCLLVNA